MGDVSDKGSECDDQMDCEIGQKNGGSECLLSDGGSDLIKTCADCGTAKTPLWRGGPAGPKSLCNACGIRSRKKRRALLGLPKEEKKPKKTATTTTTSGGDSQTSDLTTMDDYSLQRRLMRVGSEVVVQRPRSKMTKKRKKLGEEEQAAFLLMALSCGSVFA